MKENNDLIKHVLENREEFSREELIDYFLSWLQQEKNSSTFKEEFLERKIANILMELYMPIAIKGFHYLREAIIMVLNDESILRNRKVTKKLYPMIAEKNNDTSVGVERAMRHAIKVAMNNCPKQTLEKYKIRINERGSIAVTEFIATIVEYLK